MNTISMTGNISEFLKNLSTRPGVYLMYGKHGDVLYVGKARNLKRRVASYFQKTRHAPKTVAMLAQVDHVEVTVTHTETEALVLENNLIKTHQPRYNVLLRDDKGYPYIYLDTSHPFPRLSYYRGARKGKGRYFGPYPSASSVRESLYLMQKVFPIRQCDDSYFKNRARPCLQYQIKRCSGPCVGLTSAENYAEDVKNAVRFLEGRTTDIIDDLGRRMHQAAEALNFEKAVLLRDQISALSKVQEKQYVDQAGGDFDIIALSGEEGQICVYISFVRAGRQLGGKAFFPAHTDALPSTDVLASFLTQFYLNKDVPGNVLVNEIPRNSQWIVAALEQQAGHRVHVTRPQRGARRRWMDMAAVNSRDALRRRLAGHATLQARFEAIRAALELESTPERIECFDISHTLGEAAVASCVVFDGQGARKADYRRYNIAGITAGDDYAAMRQVIARRYEKVRDHGGNMPDLILIDGGPGQLNAAAETLNNMGIHDIHVIGVAKGSGRRPGLEQLFLPGRKAPLRLEPDSPALLGIQQIRDEAHRFAIAGHRARRGKARTQSSLEDIEGVGPKRRQTLLKAFGGLRGIQDAGVEDLARVSGIDHHLAQRIYEFFHPNTV